MAASADGHLKLTMAIGEAGVTYELARWKFLGAQTLSPPWMSMRACATGSSIWMLQLDVTGAAASQIPGLNVSRAGGLGVAKSALRQWVDPVIGLRARHEFAPGERFEMRGDIGGLGAGSAFSWEVYGGYAHDFEFQRAEAHELDRLSGAERRLFEDEQQRPRRMGSTPSCMAPS